MISIRLIAHALVVTGLFGLAGLCPSWAGTVTNNFTTDPAWPALGNTSNGHNYGYRSSGVAGGSNGEVGGTFARSDKDSFYAATNLLSTLNFSNTITASGKFDVNAITNMDGDVGIGFFSAATNNPSFLGVVVLEDTATEFRVGARIKNGTGGSTTSGSLYSKSANGNYWYNIGYDPAGGASSLGRLTVIVTNATSGVATATVDVTSGDRTAGITLNSFGLVGLPASNPDTNKHFDVFIDDAIYIDGGGAGGGGSILTNNFATDPTWTGVGNTTNGNNYGYRSSSVAGGGAGEVGGTFARSAKENFYAHSSFGSALTFSNFFSATGKFDVNNIVDFDGNIGLGYFSTSTNDASFVGLVVLEQSSSQFRVRGQVTTANSAETAGSATVKSIDGNYWYNINYTPTGGVSSLGRLTLIVTNASSGSVTSTVDITSTMRTAGVTLDAFGIGALPVSGGNTNFHIDVFMDDVIYATTGDTGGGAPPPTGPFIITSLTSNSTYSGTINFAVSLGALATNSIASVEYRINSRNQSMYWDGNRILRPITTGPTYSTNWHTMNVPPDSRIAFDAVARDAAGNVLGVTPTIPVQFANSNTNFRVTTPTRMQTVSNSCAFTYVVDAGPFAGTCKVSVDGKLVGTATLNNPPPESENSSFDTTKWLNGQHELNFIYWDTGLGVVGWAQFPVIFANGHTAMELRSTWKELHLTPGQTALLTTKMYYTDATTSTVTSTFSSSKPSVATVNSSGVVTAVTNGFCTVTASNGGKTSTTYIWVKSTHSFPHFAKDGYITTTWSTNSIWMRSFFATDYPTPGPAGSTNLGAQFKAAAINAYECQVYQNPEPGGTDSVAGYKAAHAALHQSLKSMAISNNLSLYLLADEVANKHENLYNTLLATNAPLLQFCISNIWATGVAIGIDMVDEVTQKWGGTPFPDDGRWMSSPPSNICNNSGITFNSGTLANDGAYVHSKKANHAWAAGNSSVRQSNYALNKQITIDLGSTNEINGMRIWNDNYGAENVGVKNYTLETSLNNSTWTTRQTNQSLAAAPRTNGYAGVYTAISSTWTNVRYVRFTVLDTYPADDAIGGFSEVMFNGRPQGSGGAFAILTGETASSSSLFWRSDSLFDVPDDAFVQLMNIMNAVPRPNNTWSPNGDCSLEDLGLWTGNAAISDYNGIYVTDLTGHLWAYPIGLNTHELHDSTKFHTYDAWEADALLPDTPSVLLMGTIGAQYIKKVANNDYTVGTDQLLAPAMHPNIMAGQVMHAVVIGMDGVRMFQYDNGQGRVARAGSNNLGGPWVIYGVGNPIDGPRTADQWAALSNAFNVVQTLQPYILQAQGHAPDYGQNLISSVRTGSNGRVLMVMNLSEKNESQTVDLSPYTTGANITRYRVLGEKTTTSTFASTSSDAVTFEPEETIFWVIPPQ